MAGSYVTMLLSKQHLFHTVLHGFEIKYSFELRPAWVIEIKFNSPGLDLGNDKIETMVITESKQSSSL